ncbi:MAG: HAD family hydrolase [Candidatus Weimeria sp.]
MMEKNRLLENTKAFIFDLDGTLVNSMWMWPEIDREFLNSRGFEVPANLKEEIDGLSMWDDAVYFKKRFGFKEKEQELIDIWNDMALHHYENDTPLKPGARELLDYLKENGIRTGLATSNSLVLCEATLRSNGVYDYFDTIVTSEDVVHGKPDPQCYIIASERLKESPAGCLVAEDLPAGLIAAKRAGMTAIAVEDDYSRQYEADKISLSDFMISDYRELIP